MSWIKIAVHNRRLFPLILQTIYTTLIVCIRDENGIGDEEFLSFHNCVVTNYFFLYTFQGIQLGSPTYLEIWHLRTTKKNRPTQGGGAWKGLCFFRSYFERSNLPLSNGFQFYLPRQRACLRFYRFRATLLWRQNKGFLLISMVGLLVFCSLSVFYSISF